MGKTTSPDMMFGLKITAIVLLTIAIGLQVIMLLDSLGRGNSVSTEFAKAIAPFFILHWCMVLIGKLAPSLAPKKP